LLVRCSPADNIATDSMAIFSDGIKASFQNLLIMINPDNMNIKTSIGRLRLIAMLEGVSLILLIFVAVPIKYFYGSDQVTKMLGPVHGALFLVFVLNTMSVAIQYRWNFRNRTWKVLVACLVPFGTFYIDRTILKKLV
jgi:integral membrane protein